jgi:thymidylate synthase
MFTFHVNDVFELWRDAVRSCLDVGTYVRDGNQKLIEMNGIAFQIDHPQSNNTDIRRYCNEEMIQQMWFNFLSLQPQFGYNFSYGERLDLHKKETALTCVVKRLQNNQDSKSTVISLLRNSDFDEGHVPCITTLDFKIRNDTLNIHYYSRSQDLFKKSYADNLAIFAIGEKVANQLAVPFGYLGGYISSGHIYEQDLPEIHSVPLFHGFIKEEKISNDVIS